jgi:anthranilate 1,2-dioxygenase (deaminating, decarboxylating) small subunit
MTEIALLTEVQDLVYREARLLDAQRWAEWTALFTDDAVFWVPAFRMDGSYTENPDEELNMIYIAGRAGMEDRIYRLETEIALSSTPVPRTSHLVGMVMIDEETASRVQAFASWQVVWVNDVRGQVVRAGSYEYVLRRTAEGLRIAQKRILLVGTVIEGYFDFYAV